MDNNAHLPQSFYNFPPWHASKQSIWPVTKLSLHRNLEGFPFPQKMQASVAKQILGEITEPLKNMLASPTLLYPSNMAPAEREYLFEHFLLNQGYEKFDDSRAFLVDAEAGFLALLHIDDHITLHLTTTQPSLMPAYLQLLSYETSISCRYPLAYSSRFGYLTSDPFLCGTGLVIEPILHLPALIHTDRLSDALEPLKDNLLFGGLGDDGTYMADIVMVENKYKLGMSEESLIQCAEKGAHTLMTEEESLRKELQEEANPDLKDKVSRAYALLSHSYQLPTAEALSALSLLELGKELGWIYSKEDLSFRDLFFKLRRAHLTKEFGPASRDELLQKRAALLHEKLREVHLAIK